MLTILQGDALDQLRLLPAESVHCCVTSPPYWGLRDYGTAAWEGGDIGCDHKAPAGVSGGQRADRTFTLGEIYKHECGKCGAKRIDAQLGLERTPEEYVANMVEVFREVRRVLRRDGTLWLNLGDSYWGGKGENGSSKARATAEERGYVQSGGTVQMSKRPSDGRHNVIKPKDLCGIPWRVAFALQADGWWLRSDIIEKVELYCPCGCGYVLQEKIWRYSQDREIIWHKPNPMPESVTDRPTKAHEYLFLLAKSARYFYDAEAIKEPHVRLWDSSNGGSWAHKERFPIESAQGNHSGDYPLPDPAGRNKRSVWTVATAPYPEAHFATYPPDLVNPCILAGTSAKGCCPACAGPWERMTTGRIGVFQTLSWQPTCKCNLSGDAKSDRSLTVNGAKPVQDDARRISGLKTGITVASPSQIIPCTVLDPFAGSGTTGMVALELGRKAILIELNPKYIELIKRRCDVTPGLALA